MPKNLLKSTIFIHKFLNPISTGGLWGPSPNIFQSCKKLYFRPYVILKRKIGLFTRKILMYVPFRSDLPFFAIWFQNFFWALTVIKDFFSKTCKTPKTAENRDTIKTKVVELGIIFHMHSFKIWKNEKKIEK